MVRHVKKFEYRFCKLCNKDVHYKLYRKVNALKKAQIKVELLAGQISIMERDSQSVIIAKN